MKVGIWKLSGITLPIKGLSFLLPSIIRVQLTVTYRIVSATLPNWLLNALDRVSRVVPPVKFAAADEVEVLTLAEHLISRKAFFATVLVRYFV